MTPDERALAFDARRLRMAREAKGWTRQRLAEAVGVTPAAVSHYENRTHRPSGAVLARMSLALGFPRSFFVAGRQTSSADVGAAHFRSLRSTTMRERRRALTHATFAWELCVLLEENLRIPQVSIPRAVLSDRASADDLENLADECRRALGVGEGPIPNVTRLLESCGAIVILLPVECRKVDAFSCVLDGRPIVVLNADKDDKARFRHTAAHELGHLVAHDDADPGSRVVERQADSFAAAFLMPANEIRPHLPVSLDWNLLISLKQHWGVSLASLLVRAHALEVMPEHTYRRGFVKLNSLRNPDGSRWRINEPGHLGPVERPSLLRKCVELVEQTGITRDDLANRLCLPKDLVDQLVGESKPEVRVDVPFS